MLNRRSFALGSVTALAAGWGLYQVAALAGSNSVNAKDARMGSHAGTTDASGATVRKKFEIVKTGIEWQKQLTPLQYRVLRKHGTERPYSSPLNKNYATGIYKCAGCDLPLFSSATKYDSRTGWPSFWKPLDNAIGTSVDYYIGYPRTEVHCKRCGGHLGHVFNDGPKPTGLRYCINGVSMTFESKPQQS